MRKFLSNPTAQRCTVAGMILCLASVLAFGLKSRVAVRSNTKATGSAMTLPTNAKIAVADTKTTPVHAHTAATKKTAPAEHGAVIASYVKLPLSFEPNLGQTNEQAKYLAHGDGYSLFLTSDEAVLALAGHAKKAGRETNAAAGVLRMQLVGSNPAPNFSAIDELPGKINYFIGKQENWRANVPTFAKVEEKNVYPGVDLVYYGSQRQLEYDFNVAAGTNPRTIEMAFEGARKLRVDAAGNLILSLAGGDVTFEKPFAYQMKGEQKNPVAVRFHLGDKKYRVYFAVGDYDPSRALVIDPILAYSTYLGGSGIDGANGIAVAPDNTAFVAGGTSSPNFPAVHALQPNDGGPNDFPNDAFVTKISADGSTLVYSTYLGGKNQDQANGIAVDAAGEAFVIGTTLSPDFPTTPGSFNSLCGGDGKCGASFNTNGLIVSNGFLTKINAAGSAIIYSGFIGEYENVQGLAVAVDQNQNAYVTGSAQENFIPSTTGGTPTVLTILPSPSGAISNGNGTSTIFVTSAVQLPINQLVTISGVGGTTADPNPASPFDGTFTVLSSAPGSFVIAAAGGAASGNGTATLGVSPPFPITSNAFQPFYGGGPTDAFVGVINASGSGYLYSTYLGGNSDDSGHGIATDRNAGAYVTGITDSTNFPLSATPFQGTYGGAGDAFFTELNTNSPAVGSGLLYSTYLGGNDIDQGNAIAVDPTSCVAGGGNTTTCNAYIAGGTSSTGLGTPATVVQPNCTLDTQLQCEGDAFVAEFNPGATGASSLLFFTYLGGSLADSASGIALDPQLNIYVTGSTVSQDFPTNGAPFQPAYGGGNDDAFVTKLNANATGFMYSSYLGGTFTDNGNGIAVDTTGSAYIAGQTCSFDFPIANAEQVSQAGNCDAFISKVAILNGIALNPSGLVFPAQSLNTTSAPEVVTLTNGQTTLTSLSIALGGDDAGDFAMTTDCAAPIAAGGNCTISVTFTPTANGVRKATITLTDNAPGSPQTINLTGTTSTLTLSTSSLNFGSVTVGTTSAPMGVIATNVGSTPISFTSVTASGEFAETDDCTAVALQPGTNCTVEVTYTPVSNSASVGALTLTDNAPGSPQIVMLNGSGFVQQPDFTIGAITPSGTVTAGGTASFNIVLTSIAGFSQPLNLSCTGLPAKSSCSFPTNPVTPTAAGATAQVNISTSERTMMPPSGNIRVTPPASKIRNINVLWTACLLILLLFGGLTAGTQRGRRAAATLVFAVVLILFSVACNGGGAAGVPAGTPAGTYTVMVTAATASGTITHSTPLTLQVN